jgi:hypothetical protein
VTSYTQALQYARTHPRRLDFETLKLTTWDQWCETLLWRITGAGRASAILAFRASGAIVSRDPMLAPPGAIHWWDIGKYGHVAMATENGWALMASRRVRQPWGDAIGVTPVADYTAQVGAKTYLGWTLDHCGQIITNDLPIVAEPGVAPIIRQSEEDELMSVMVPIYNTDGSFGGEYQPLHMVLGEVLLNSRNALPQAQRDARFESRTIKAGDGSPQQVTMGVLADDTLASIRNVAGEVRALAAASGVQL